MREGNQAPAPREVREIAPGLGPLPRDEKEKGSDERPADKSADDRGHEHARGREQELVRSEPQDLDRPMQILRKAFVHLPFSSCFMTPAKVPVSGDRPSASSTWPRANASGRSASAQPHAASQTTIPKVWRMESALIRQTAATMVGMPIMMFEKRRETPKRKAATPPTKPSGPFTPWFTTIS